MNIKQEVKDLQQRLSVLESRLLENHYDWDNAPVICQLDGVEYRFGPEAEKELTWEDAVKWCESVGGELPDRLVLLACWMNVYIKTAFTEGFHWSSTKFSSTNVWGQDCINGNQEYYSKTCTSYVRAVKCFPIDN